MISTPHHLIAVPPLNSHPLFSLVLLLMSSTFYIQFPWFTSSQDTTGSLLLEVAYSNKYLRHLHYLIPLFT
jgi:hypothetical protein